VITSWKSRKLQKFFEKGIHKGIDRTCINKLLYLLVELGEAQKPSDLNKAGYDFHPLKGDKKGFYSLKVTANYRLTFSFKGENVILVDYEDYH